MNVYRFDAEGRICAVQLPSDSGGHIVGYLYDVSGLRVATGSLQAMSCDLSQNGFSPTQIYTIGFEGQETVQLDGLGNWMHTNAILDGSIVGTYDVDGLHFALGDIVGTKRVQTSAQGDVEESCASLPYGDSRMCTLMRGADADSVYFAGHRRDEDTLLDYFIARYYSSTSGRFLSPDDGSDQSLADPQSLNLYSYARNSPLVATDPSGRQCLIKNQSGGSTLGVDVTVNGPVCDTSSNNGFGELSETVSVSASNLEDNLQTIALRVKQGVSSVSDTLNQTAQTTVDFLTAPRDLGCLLGSVAQGTKNGAAIGAVAGGGLGAAGGSIVGPEGTLALGFFGAADGALTGGSLGFDLGVAVGTVACRQSGSSSGGGGGGGGGGGRAKGAGRQGAFWKGLKPFKNGLKTNGLTGSKLRYYQMDDLHGDVEVINRSGNHLGSVDSETGLQTKAANPAYSYRRLIK